MKKGFMLTAIATILFMLLIDTAFQYSKTSSAYSQRISEMIVSEKMGYTFDDITEDVTDIMSITIVQRESDLILKDSFPATNISQNLARYENFIRWRYLSSELEATFLTSDEQQTNLSNLTSQITVQPFAMTYNYTNFSKNDLFIQIPYAQSGAIQYIWYNVSVNSGNFTNISDISWNPAPQACVVGTQGCIKFYMKVNDSADQEYIPPYSVFDMTQNAGHVNISFVNQSCWLEMWLGKNASQQYLFIMGIHNCSVKTDIGLSLNTSNFWLHFPMKLKVRDINYNTSKEDNIGLIMTRLLR